MLQPQQRALIKQQERRSIIPSISKFIKNNGNKPRHDTQKKSRDVWCAPEHVANPEVTFFWHRKRQRRQTSFFKKRITKTTLRSMDLKSFLYLLFLSFSYWNDLLGRYLWWIQKRKNNKKIDQVDALFLATYCWCNHNIIISHIGRQQYRCGCDEFSTPCLLAHCDSEWPNANKVKIESSPSKLSPTTKFLFELSQAIQPVAITRSTASDSLLMIQLNT